MSHETANMGRLGTMVPIMAQEVAPGDTWSGKSGVLIRLSPLKRALLNTLYVDLFTFYVPHRLTQDNWEEFIAAGPSDNPTFQVPNRS